MLFKVFCGSTAFIQARPAWLLFSLWPCGWDNRPETEDRSCGLAAPLLLPPPGAQCTVLTTAGKHIFLRCPSWTQATHATGSVRPECDLQPREDAACAPGGGAKVLPVRSVPPSGGATSLGGRFYRSLLFCFTFDVNLGPPDWQFWSKSALEVTS